MDINIRRVEKDLPLPEYKTSGAVAMDAVIREDTTIPARGIAYAPLNISVKPPAGHFILMAARSSLHKKGLMLANGIGLFDEDFSGDADEYKVVLYNFTDSAVTVARGDRLVQLMCLPHDRVTWNEVDSLGDPSRGGFGTTGTR
jgi:dUTP pyrophosphatase